LGSCIDPSEFDYCLYFPGIISESSFPSKQMASYEYGKYGYIFIFPLIIYVDYLK